MSPEPSWVFVVIWVTQSQSSALVKEVVKHRAWNEKYIGIWCNIENINLCNIRCIIERRYYSLLYILLLVGIPVLRKKQLQISFFQVAIIWSYMIFVWAGNLQLDKYQGFNAVSAKGCCWSSMKWTNFMINYDHLSLLSSNFCQSSQTQGNISSEHLYTCGVSNNS